MPLSNKNIAFSLFSLFVVVSMATSCAKRHAARPMHKEVGMASWYGPKFHGKRTASGERYDQRKLTAAHPSLPFGTKVRVTNIENDRSVVVEINDRGPFIRNRIIDLSKAAAKEIGMLGCGVARVELEIDGDCYNGYGKREL